jgi:hypothetical protein
VQVLPEMTSESRTDRALKLFDRRLLHALHRPEFLQ